MKNPKLIVRQSFEKPDFLSEVQKFDELQLP